MVFCVYIIMLPMLGCRFDMLDDKKGMSIVGIIDDKGASWLVSKKIQPECRVAKKN